MASTNYLQWNPGSANQESDATYLADSLRSGGATVNAIFGSALANKVLYQASTMATAIANAMVAHGVNASDASLSTLTTNFVLFLQQIVASFTALVVVAFSATPVFDASQGSSFAITLTGNVTGSTLTNLIHGQIITFIIHQDGTGTHTFVWPTNVATPGTVDPTASETSTQSFIVDDTGTARPLTLLTVS